MNKPSSRPSSSTSRFRQNPRSTPEKSGGNLLVEFSGGTNNNNPFSEEPLDGETNQFITEYWNMKKAVLELSSDSLKIRNDLKTSRHLVKNLQTLLTSQQADNVTRSKENNALKTKISELEKKVEELNEQVSVLTTNNTKQKRANFLSQQRFQECDKAFKAHLATCEEATASLKKQAFSRDDNLFDQLNERKKQIADLQQETVSLNTILHHSNLKVEELEKENDRLLGVVRELEEKIEKDQLFFSNQLEKAYDELHSKLELVTSERQEFYKKYLDKEHENTQLMSFILSEGLQMPRIQKVNL